MARQPRIAGCAAKLHANRHILSRFLYHGAHRETARQHARQHRQSCCWVWAYAVHFYTDVLFEDAGEAGCRTQPKLVSSNTMEKPERQEEVGPHGAPNLQQDQVVSSTGLTNGSRATFLITGLPCLSCDCTSSERRSTASQTCLYSAPNRKFRQRGVVHTFGGCW